jgi:hypothetical protein
MLSCQEVTRLIASEDINHAGWLKRLELRLHLMMCRHCRAYAAQLEAIGKAVRHIWGIRPYDPTSIQRLRGQILASALGGTGDPNPFNGHDFLGR